MPTGKMCASGGSIPSPVFGTSQCIIAEKPTVEINNPASIPFKVKPLPNKNKSLNPEAKQNLLLCNVKPVAFDNIQTDAKVESDAENITENSIDNRDNILPVYKFFLCFENWVSFVFVVMF